MELETPELTKRLKQLIDFQSNGNVSKFADIIGFSQQKINRFFIIDNRTNKYATVTSDVLIKITEMFVNISPDWLLNGKGKMYRSQNIDSKYLFEGFYNPDLLKNTIEKKGKEKGKELVSNLNIHKTLPLTVSGYSLKDFVDKDPTGNYTPIPLYGQEAAAGFGTAEFSLQEHDIQRQYIVPDFKKIDFMIRINGSSMYPKYNSGDVIAVRVLHEKAFIQWNKVHLIATKEQGLLVKRLKKSTNDDNIICASDNKEYDAFEVPWKEIEGVALVIGVIRLE